MDSLVASGIFRRQGCPPHQDNLDLVWILSRVFPPSLALYVVCVRVHVCLCVPVWVDDDGVASHATSQLEPGEVDGDRELQFQRCLRRETKEILLAEKKAARGNSAARRGGGGWRGVRM